jgi:hypothetical protein
MELLAENVTKVTQINSECFFDLGIDLKIRIQFTHLKALSSYSKSPFRYQKLQQ